MNSKRELWLLGACFIPTPALLAATPAVTDPAAAAPSANYRSAFEGYKPFKEEAIADWRAVNEEVGRVGGHVGIMGGAAGHAGHGAGPAKPAITTEGGQPPVRGASKAPAGGAHHGH